MKFCRFVLHRPVSALVDTCIKLLSSVSKVASTPRVLPTFYEVLLFQVFQLITPSIRGSATHGEKFIISLDRVVIDKKEVRGVMLCVQDIVRSPHFRVRAPNKKRFFFFSESGFTMLSASVAIADSITSSPVYAPWSVAKQHVRTRSSLICVPLGIGLFCVVALRKTPVSAGIMVAALGLKNHQGQGWKFQASLRRGALNMCQLQRLLLVLLGQAKFVLPPVNGRERSLGAQWSCRRYLKFRVLQLFPSSDLYQRIQVSRPPWQHKLLVGSRVVVGVIVVPLQCFKRGFPRDHLLYFNNSLFASFRPYWTALFIVVWLCCISTSYFSQIIKKEENIRMIK